MALNISNCSSIPISALCWDDISSQTLDLSERIHCTSSSPRDVYGGVTGWSGLYDHIDPVDFLPSDPFGMDMDCNLTTMADWIGGFRHNWMHNFDPTDLLPLDPFGMNPERTVTAAIAGLMEDLRAICGDHGVLDNQVFGASSYFSARSYHDRIGGPPGIFCTNVQRTLSAAVTGWIEDIRILYQDYPMVNDHYLGGFSHYLGEQYIDTVNMLPSDPFDVELEITLASTIATLIGDSRNFESQCELVNGNTIMDSELSLNSSSIEAANFNDSDDDLHQGLFFALGYLGVRDLLAVERTCKALNYAVKNDPLLWRSICINSSLSYKITDDTLLRLTRRAQGNLQCLSLVSSTKITNGGLKKVLENNPRLRKLYVPCCLKLTIDGLMSNLKAFKVQSTIGIQHLKLGRLFNVSKEHFEELKFLLGSDGLPQETIRKVRFYHIARIFSELDDDCPLDIEMCPICQNYKLVYGCPSETCKGRGSDFCRACDLCIKRCAQCGKCIKDDRYDVTFSYEYLCMQCWENPTIW